MANRQNLKLSPRFYGPYQILKRIGEVAYKLELRPSSSIHPVFHVSQLKKKLGPNIDSQPNLPPTDQEGAIRPEPAEIIERRLRKVFTGGGAVGAMARASRRGRNLGALSQAEGNLPTPCGQGVLNRGALSHTVGCSWARDMMGSSTEGRKEAMERGLGLWAWME